MKLNRPLLLRSNRFLGSSLVDNGLIQVEDLDLANQQLLEVMQSGNLKQACILNILIWELRTLNEADVIDYIHDRYSLGMIDLTQYDVESGYNHEIDLGDCWATWTLPFDRMEDFHFLATSYYMSDPVKKHWENILEGEIIWYVTSIAMVYEALERLQAVMGIEEEVPNAGSSEES